MHRPDSRSLKPDRSKGGWMAKIRVYELARDLNMKNKVLLDKVKEMDITVASHMSSLDEETVAKIKENIFGKKAVSVEMIRVRPTVIRRRRKKIEEKPVQIETVQEAEEIPEKETVSEEAPAVETHADASAATEEAPQETPSVMEVEEKIDEAAIPEMVEAIPVEEVSDIKAVPDKDERLETPETLETPELQEVPKVEKQAEVKKLKPKRQAKRLRKDTPAKILKLPVTPREKAPEPEKPIEITKAPEPGTIRVLEKNRRSGAFQEPEQEITEPLVPEFIEEEDKKRKGRKREEEPFRDKKFFKKKISFRKKAVVEGEDLYDEAKRGRKTRKGAKAKTAVIGLKPQITTPKAIKRRIKIDDTIVLSDLAKRMGIKAGEMITKLMGLGVMVTVNQTIDFDTAVLVASEFDYELEKAAFEEELFLKIEKDDPEKLVTRPPVVTIMGHVDHGKTSLLDVIRKTKVTDLEAGGITQHIGAYNVSTDSGQVVFLDTPGHEAFTAMRARGAKVTDLVVLVVAADDGVMPQTIEAINHARASEVPVIVAINKIDKTNADPERVRRELAEIGLVPEDWGGDTIFLNVSAKQNQGINELLEMILLQAEVLELKANPNKLARGHVIEAKLDSGRGPVATILVNDGTLHTGESIVCGVHYGKIRAMLNDRGVPVDMAGPSSPVEIIGLSGVPMAGDELIALADDKDAKQVSLHRIQQQRSKDLAKTNRLSLEGLFEQMQEGDVKDLNLIIKADVNGSIEAIKDSLTKLSNEEVKINVVHSATGTITESDISLAQVSNAIIIGFNIRPTSKISDLAAEEKIDIRYYDIIYNVIKDIKDAIIGLMSSTFKEHILGRAEVREIFHVPKVGTIAGSYITEGKIERGQLVRLLRDGVVRYDGKISSLRRFKDDVKEVQTGYECGIGIENYNDIKLSDIIECYYLEEIRPELI